MIMSLKQRETKFILRIKIINPQHGQPIDTDTQLIWTLPIAPSVYFLDGGWTRRLTKEIFCLVKSCFETGLNNGKKMN